jgi:hypothetical protein
MRKSRANDTRKFREDESMVTTAIYAERLQEVLERKYGPLRNAAKILGGMAGVSHRTAQNWLDGKNAPQGAALLNLMAKDATIDAEMTRLKSLARGEGK